MTVADTFTLCLSRISDADLKRRMQQAVPLVIAASNAYDLAAANTNLHLIQATTSVGNGLVSRQEMKSLYSGRMAAAGSPGRDIYDELLIAADDAQCPLCGHRDVSTLDHILAKSRFPHLTITPWNLVPCCPECNKAKGNASPSSKETQFLHPYYDAIENDPWLWCEILETSPASVKFFINPFPGWSQTTTDRVRNQFDKLGIAKLYVAQGGRELSNIRKQMVRLSDKGGAIAVREHLHDAFDSRLNIQVNSWQTALYRAAWENSWYWSGGFHS